MLDPMALLRAMPGACAQGIIWGLMALGVYLTFKILDVADLTVDGSIATGGAVAVMLILAGWSPAAAMAAAFAVGMLTGAVTGVLHVALGIPAILASILTQISLYSINLNIMGKSNQAVSVDKFPLLVSLRYIPKAIAVCLVIAVALICVMYWFFGTELGCSIRATACNKNMARAQGVNTSVITVLTLALSNGIVALSGSLLAQYQGFADVNMGRGAIVIGLAAVIIGEVIGGAVLGKYLNFMGRLAFVVVGGVIYYMVLQIVYWLKLPTDDSKLFTAIIVALFLAVPYLKGKYFTKSSYKKEASRHA